MCKHFSTRHDHWSGRSLERCSGRIFNFTPRSHFEKESKEQSISFWERLLLLFQVIANCIVLLILSSALPVLSRTLGITKFDLMGEFGRLDWLGNFRVVILYNLVFEVSTAFCLVNKFTASVRNALYEQVQVPTVQFFRRFHPKAKASV